MDAAARTEALEAENQRLRDRILELEDLVGLRLPFCLPFEWRLTASETRVFGALYRRDLATKDMIMAALYEPGADSEPAIKIVDVFVCKMRRKLLPFGVEIVTRWGVGYELAPQARAIVRALGDQSDEAAA